MLDYDTFNGKFRPEITGSTWGQGEYGYSLTIFSSHDKKQVEKALEYLIKLNKLNETR